MLNLSLSSVSETIYLLFSGGRNDSCSWFPWVAFEVWKSSCLQSEFLELDCREAWMSQKSSWNQPAPCNPDSWLFTSRPCLYSSLKLLYCGSACTIVANSWCMCPSRMHYMPPGCMHSFGSQHHPDWWLVLQRVIFLHFFFPICWLSCLLHCEKQWIVNE